MADLKKRMHFINILLDKWLSEEKLSNEELGKKVRQWYYQNENRVEHWMIDEGNIPWKRGDDNNSRRYDNNYGEEDDIYK